ncbi:MAG: HRDC domain-containing protein [Kiritimatiellia bacterium]|nr:HRDC domain-containing protein [Kiritimatiellia bacterium]
MTTIITTPQQLKQLATELLQTSAIALDTEFLWERTYYPILGLVQVAPCDGQAILIDTIALPDLSPLHPVLEDTRIVKIFHDAPQDMRIISRATGNAHIRNVFDTRIAAGFAGLSSAIGLQALLQELLGITLAKSETRSDWTARPLTQQQLNYAAEDVIYLHKAREELLRRTVSRDLLFQELAKLDDLESPQPAEERWRKVKGHNRLPPLAQCVLRRLATWRENYAMQCDRPRNAIVRDELLISLAQGLPLPPKGHAKALTDQLLAEIRSQALHDTPPKMMPKTSIDRTILRDKSFALMATVAEKARSKGIDPALIITRHAAEQFVLAGISPDDWRKDFYPTTK